MNDMLFFFIKSSATKVVPAPTCPGAILPTQTFFPAAPLPSFTWLCKDFCFIKCTLAFILCALEKKTTPVNSLSVLCSWNNKRPTAQRTVFTVISHQLISIVWRVDKLNSNRGTREATEKWLTPRSWLLSEKCKGSLIYINSKSLKVGRIACL